MIRQAEQWLKEGVIHPTKSPNNFPLLLVSKGAGKAPRLCLDLRDWNAGLISEWYEVPNTRHLVADLASSRVYSSIDATAGYHMVVLADDDGPIPSSEQMAFTLPPAESLDGDPFVVRRQLDAVAISTGLNDAEFSPAIDVRHTRCTAVARSGRVRSVVRTGKSSNVDALASGTTAGGVLEVGVAVLGLMHDPALEPFAPIDEFVVRWPSRLVFAAPVG